jgi:hypothetical protein
LQRVLICNGDETAKLVQLGLDPRRFTSICTSSAKRESVRGMGWAQADLPLDAVDEGIGD